MDLGEAARRGRSSTRRSPVTGPPAREGGSAPPVDGGGPALSLPVAPGGLRPPAPFPGSHSPYQLLLPFPFLPPFQNFLFLSSHYSAVLKHVSGDTVPALGATRSAGSELREADLPAPAWHPSHGPRLHTSDTSPFARPFVGRGRTAARSPPNHQLRVGPAKPSRLRDGGARWRREITTHPGLGETILSEQCPRTPSHGTPPHDAWARTTTV